MSRKKSKPGNSEAEQAEILNSTVRMDGVGESPLVQAVLSNKFAEATNLEAIDIALLLQQMIRGQNSMLSKQNELSDELNKLRGKMDGFDKAAKAWEDDRAGFLAKVNDRAGDLRIDDPAKKAALIAKEAQRVQAEIQMQRANGTVDKLRFQQLLESQEKEMIESPGKWVTVNEAGVIQQRCEPETIKIKHLSWTLQPNVPTLVPKLVADEFRSRQKIRSDTNERKALLNAGAAKENTEVAKKWNELNRKNNVGGDAFRGDSR
jgi:hypothetical protein